MAINANVTLSLRSGRRFGQRWEASVINVLNWLVRRKVSVASKWVRLATLSLLLELSAWISDC